MEQPQNVLHRFGEVGKDLGLLTDAQIEAALQKQLELRAAGAKSRLGEALIANGVLTVEQVKRVLSEQRKRRQPAAEKALPMERFGDYVLQAKLGEGGMGAVYKAHDALADRTVALKVLRSNLAGNQAFVSRFERESKLAGSLNHPNIVTCYAAGTIRGVQYLAMEFVDGETLSGRLRRSGGKLPEKEALRIVRDVALGVAQAHAANIIHRDLKPDNILMGRDGSVKVSDFGTAKSILNETTLSMTGQVIGTPNYISPEQVRAAPDVDGRADLYALGGTLYHILTGQLPFSASTALAVMKAHLHDDLENPQDINPELSDGVVAIVVKLMAKLPAQRYQTAKELIEDLDSVLTDAAPKRAAIDVNASSIRPARRPRKKRAAARSQGCMGVVLTVIAVTSVVVWLINCNLQ